MGVTAAAGAPRLIAFGGLPGVGKTTLARALARRLGAVALRIDTIEQAIRDAGVLSGGVGTAGYRVANALAEAHLAQGLSVVADAVNPVEAARQGWRDLAARAGARLVEIEVVCSDEAEHRRRVETRPCDVPGLVSPSWAAVESMDVDAWPEAHLVVDTARCDPDRSLGHILAELGSAGSVG